MAAQSPRIVGFQSSAPADTSAPAANVSPRFSTLLDTGGIEQLAVPVPIARSAQLLPLQDLGTGRCFVHPLYVSVEQNGDEWFALSADLVLVGEGESDLDALDDLRAKIGELFDSLVEMRSELGPVLRKQLMFLERLAGTL
jgi:hypothetical protein